MRVFGHNLEKTARTFLSLIGSGDVERVMEMCADDIAYIDSLGIEVRGRAEVAQLLGTMRDMGLQLMMYPEKFRRFRDEVYVSGHFTGNDPRFNARCEWRLRFRGKKVAEYQTSRPDHPPSIVNILNNFAERERKSES